MGNGYLTSKKRPKVAHIWTGSDTACRMYGTGGLKQKKYQVTDSDMGLPICTMCERSSAPAGQPAPVERLCHKCGKPIAFKRLANGKWCPTNPDGSDHWDDCSKAQNKPFRMESSPVITGSKYKPTGCGCLAWVGCEKCQNVLEKK